MYKVGDKVIVTVGDFKGERGARTDKKLIGDGITVALEKDGKEISREVVLTGFGRTDTHELPNSLTWGPDGSL